MRRAFELAFSTAYVFSSGQPRVQVIDDVQFQRPVEIGTLLRLNARVVATRSPEGPDQDPILAVEVEHASCRARVGVYVLTNSRIARRSKL